MGVALWSRTAKNFLRNLCQWPICENFVPRKFLAIRYIRIVRDLLTCDKWWSIWTESCIAVVYGLVLVMCQQHIRPVCYILRRYAWLYAYKLQTGCPMSNVMHTSCKLDVLWVVWLKWMSVLFVVNTRHSGWHDLSSLIYDSTNRWGSSQDWSFQTLQDPVSKLCSSLFPLESVDWSLAKVCGGGCQPVHGKDQEVRDTVI